MTSIANNNISKDNMQLLKDNNMNQLYLQLENGCIFVETFQFHFQVKNLLNCLKKMLQIVKN